MQSDVPQRLPALSFLHRLTCGLAFLAAALAALPVSASLNSYDAAIGTDAGNGLTPLARLTNAVTFFGTNKAPFNFGPNSGDVTMELVLEGNPNAGSGSTYLSSG
jgi:hypothetical protein